MLLVDEYDSPMLDSNNNEELQAEIRGIIARLFQSVESAGRIYFRFLFLTGISKFSQMSIFSELNNLQNISMQDAYSAICGITENELRTQLEEDIRRMAEANGETYDEACIHLKQQYDGYHFSENSEDIYNPFSLFNAFAQKKYANFWFSTGTPTFLIRHLAAKRISIFVNWMAFRLLPSSLMHLPMSLQTRFRYFTKAVISLSKSMTGIFRSIHWLILTKKFGKALSNH